MLYTVRLEGMSNWLEVMFLLTAGRGHVPEDNNTGGWTSCVVLGIWKQNELRLSFQTTVVLSNWQKAKQHTMPQHWGRRRQEDQWSVEAYSGCAAVTTSSGFNERPCLKEDRNWGRHLTSTFGLYAHMLAHYTCTHVHVWIYACISMFIGTHTCMH